MPTRMAGTIVEDNKTCAAVIGMYDDEKKTLVPLEGLWYPRHEEKVIGTVVEARLNTCSVDLYAPYKGIIIFKYADGDIANGDIVDATVKELDKTGTVVLSRPRVLRGGKLVFIKPSKIPRLLGKGNTMIKQISEGTMSSIEVGMNGAIWINGGDVDRATEAILKVEEEAHISGLTESIGSMWNIGNRMAEDIQLMIDGKRLDGRRPDELRNIAIKANVIKNAAGSAYIEWGNNKIIAAVYGPREALPKHTQNPERAVIKCRYTMATFSSSEEHGRAGMNRRAVEISKVTAEVFENVLLLEEFPGTEISLFIEVLQGDGGTRAAGITCASVALAASGIPMRDMPYAVSAGKVGDTVILDMNKIEDNYSDADVPVAINPRSGNVTLLQMDGELTKEEFKTAMSMIKNAGPKITEAQKSALRAPYEASESRYR